MLVVGPASCMLPINDSLVVLTTSTLFVEESNDIKVERFGEIAISPGATPALISPFVRTSISPLMMSKPDNAVGLDTLCEARTRW
jgi:hypothetical protein